MFEQELYNAEPAEKPQEGDLFYNYERTNWDIGPRVYKILAFSAVLNLAVIGFIAQSDVLTRRGCDSPWVGRVCQVLDMAYVGSMLYGTDRDFVDQAYDKIDLGDAEVTFIDVSNAEPQFRYPADYDKYANPEKLLAQTTELPLPAGFDNPLPTYTSPGGSLLSRAPELPKANPKNNIDDIPGFDDGVGGLSKKGKIGRNKGNNPPSNTTSDQTTAQNNSNANASATPEPPISSDPVTEVELNKRPIADLGNYVNDLKAKNLVDLQSDFVISAKGRLDKDGRLDPKTFRFLNTSSKDPKMFEVVKTSVEAVNVAGYMRYLQAILGKDVGFTFQQDAENLSATLQSDLESESRAVARKSTLDLMIAAWKKSKSNENSSQNEKDDFTLLQNVTTEVKGKSLIIKFVVPKNVAHPMIERKLAEQAAELLKKPSGQITTKTGDTSAIR